MKTSFTKKGIKRALEWKKLMHIVRAAGEEVLGL